MRINNLQNDLQDGVVYFRLLEILTNKKLKGWHENPKTMITMLDNHSLFIKSLPFFGIKIKGLESIDS
jgi:hypothetical protein